jgi:CHAT domain
MWGRTVINDAKGNADSDARIDAIRALLPAVRGTDELAELAGELTGLIVERYAIRAAAGDVGGAAEDLGTVIQQLADVLARIGTSHARYPELAMAAGYACQERWTAFDDLAGRDDAVRHFSSALAVMPESEPDRPAVHAALALLLGSRAEDDAGSGNRWHADLDAAVEHTRTGLALLRPQRRDVTASEDVTAPEDAASSDAADADLEIAAELREILGLALAHRFNMTQYALQPADAAGIAAARADRDEAIAQLGQVLDTPAPDDPVRLDVADVIGRLRHDRYADPWPDGPAQDPADLDAAIDLLLRVADAEPGTQTLMYLVFALSDRVDVTSEAGDLDALITWGERLIGHPDTAADLAADSHGLLGGALLDRAAVGSPTRTADLRAAIEHWEAALAAMAPGDPDRAGTLARLAHAFQVLLDGDASRYADVDKMTGYALQAWQLLPSGHELRPDAGIYLVEGLHERLRRPGQPMEIGDLDTGIEVLMQLEPLAADDQDLHLMVVVELGIFLVGRAQIAGSSADLAAAAPWVMQAAAALPADDPRFAAERQTVAASMFTLATLGMTLDNLQTAIGLLTARLQEPDADPGRRAMTRCALGTAYAQLAAFTQCGSDLEAGIAHLTAAFDLAAAGDAVRIGIAWNLGSALLTRFLRTGDLQDRDAARYYLEVMDEPADSRTGEALRAAMQDVELARTAMHGLLRLAEGIGGNRELLDDAVLQLRKALAMLPADHPYHGRIRSDLGLALAMQAAWVDGADIAGFQQARDEQAAAMAALPPGHMMRPFALMRAGGSLAAAAATSGDPQQLRAAIGYLTSALADMDHQFGGRVRLVASLGWAWHQLHRLTGDPAALAAAARWLAAACDELRDQPHHPEYAACLTMLAQVQLARGMRGRAREAGLAALRGRGRDVLLQTGTARSLGIARTAAREAADVAAWCLRDKDPAAALDAVELGRGLVLHAATSVADVPWLLTGAGHSDLAEEWRTETASPSVPPWDVGPDSAAQAAGLRAGTAAPQVPSDLRARVLAALAGPVVDRLLAPPAPTQIAVALSVTGGDALIYLLAPARNQAGCAIAVPAASLAAAARPAAVPEVIPLPLLRFTGHGVIDDYLAWHAIVAQNAAERPADDTEPRFQGWLEARQLAAEGLNAALLAVCQWAWPAVMRPLLDWARRQGLSRPPRLVLVPIGPLSLVPWHAAVERADRQARARYACAEAVISYAASARQLIDVSGRPALDLQASPVIVGNPTLDLTYAGIEAQAIRDRCYPDGRYLGYAVAAAGRPADGTGEADDVLRQLPAASGPGASMIHLACHAVAAGSAPGSSYLLLADRKELPLDRILRRASARPTGAAGCLVSLAACGSDLAAGDYDEALTLATAFLAAGAVTVVGTRWEVPDGRTALLMFMFHHFLTAEGQSPRDALRMAQLWMLAPDRTAPPKMPSHLAADASNADLAEPFAWAAVTHQGR